MAFGQIFLFWKGYTMEELETFMFWRMNLTYLGIAFWIWNIVIWSKRDKKIGQFFALFFLPGLYTMFYYRRVLKNNWLNAKEENILQS
jgi:hypothetical protein